jgi:hypothetical protein
LCIEEELGRTRIDTGFNLNFALCFLRLKDGGFWEILAAETNRRMEWLLYQLQIDEEESEAIC